MLGLKHPAFTAPQPADSIEFRTFGEPKPIETASYISSSGATVMTSKGLAESRSAAVPPAPTFDLFGERVSHMTGRFVLSGSGDAYRIWRFRSADPAIEFPVTEEGWVHAWTAFRRLESQAV